MKSQGAPYKKTDAGRVLITWNGTAGSTLLNIPHKLGVEPKNVFLRLDDIGQVSVAVLIFKDAKMIQIAGRASSAVANGSTTAVDWFVGA